MDEPLRFLCFEDQNKVYKRRKLRKPERKDENVEQRKALQIKVFQEFKESNYPKILEYCKADIGHFRKNSDLAQFVQETQFHSSLISLFSHKYNP